MRSKRSFPDKILDAIRESKIFATVSALVLALGIAANSVAFSFANTLFLRPLRVEQTRHPLSAPTEPRLTAGRECCEAALSTNFRRPIGDVAQATSGYSS